MLILRTHPIDAEVLEALEVAGGQGGSSRGDDSGELLVGAASCQRYGCTLVTGNGLELGTFAMASDGYADGAYLLDPTTAAETAQGTQEGGPGDAWATVVASFEPAP